MNILVIGDIVGKPGRQTVAKLLPGLRRQYDLDLVIANAENAAGGLGLTVGTAHELMESGVDVMTSGNHIWAQKEILPHLDSELPVLRPLNYPPGVPGRGSLEIGPVTVVNIIGRVFIDNFDCPFRAMDTLLERRSGRPPVIIVDFHAEATSEKIAMGHYLDGRVSAVLGTHTHVGTIDSRVLPGGTAFVTDIGMVGPADSVLGDDVDKVLERFLTLINRRLPVASGRSIFNAVMVEVDEKTGRATGIERVNREVE